MSAIFWFFLQLQPNHQAQGTTKTKNSSWREGLIGLNSIHIFFPQKFMKLQRKAFQILQSQLALWLGVWLVQECGKYTFLLRDTCIVKVVDLWFGLSLVWKSSAHEPWNGVKYLEIGDWVERQRENGGGWCANACNVG